MTKHLGKISDENLSQNDNKDQDMVVEIVNNKIMEFLRK